jgi:hypothetical protein
MASRHESPAERQIRLAREAGEFDGLAGIGKPLPGLDDSIGDEDWWIKEKLRREQVVIELPPALAIREAKRALLASIGDFTDESSLRSSLEQLNERISYVNRVATAGPPSTTMMIDVEAIVAAWRQGQPS